MSKLTVGNIVPGELYVFTNPFFSYWVGQIARAIRPYEHSSTIYVFELIELSYGARSLGYKIGAQLPLKVNFFERYPLIPSASDPLFS
jgi:hypothetical protein